MAAAAELAGRYPHGVWWVPLGSLRDPTLVLETAAQALGSKVGVVEHIADRSMLLLFDNFEQVIEAAADLAALLASCPNLDLLMTSREPLRISGEHEYRVPSFAHSEAVGFFLSRARAVRADFQADSAVSEICRRLDDLPLALELAAARVKVLSSRQLLERLEQRLPLLTGGARDRPERQRTLHAAIAWSYELLMPNEQRLFARLAVFAGGCTVESAEDVAAAALDDLQSLVDKSLLQHNEDRFTMLETIREYAAERLEESGDAEALERRHAAQFLALAEEAEPNTHLYSADWIERLETEHDNLRAALDYFAASGESELVLRLAGALSDFWNYGGHVAEGWRRLESALEAEERPTAGRAKALIGAAGMAYGSGDAAKARVLGEKGLALHRQIGDMWGAAYALNLLGVAYIEEGDHDRALQAVEEAVGLFDKLGDDQFTVAATRTLAFAHYSRGDLDRARALHEGNLLRARAGGMKETEAGTLGSLAIIAVDQGRVDDALALAKENVLVARDLGSAHGIAQSLCRAAEVLARFLGNARAAA
ncbi:MAG: protein kinase, partial [Actinomycetota bacterium]|nr:protein kinase [Actinomycetota bacterium]